MGQIVEVQVPDIGDFKDVEVIEVLVKPGDTVAKEQSLITVESDKASMEIPSSAAGVVKEMQVKLGDKVSQGSARAAARVSDGRRPPRRAAAAAPSKARRCAKAPAPPAPHRCTAAPRRPPAARSKSWCPTSATSRTSRSSRCWSSPATR